MLGHPFTLCWGIVGDVQLNPHQAIQPGAAHAGLVDDVPFHDLAADAPVGGQFDDGRLALAAGCGQLLADVARVAGLVEVVAAAVEGGGAGAGVDVLQRTQRVAASGQGAEQGGGGVDGQQQGEGLGQAAHAAAGLAFEQAELNCRSGGQCAPQNQTERTGDDALQQPDGHGQQTEGEGLFDVVEPGAGARQQGAAEHGDDDQRYAHAQGQGKQLQGTAEGVAGGADVDQCAGQWGGDAGRYHQ